MNGNEEKKQWCLSQIRSRRLAHPELDLTRVTELAIFGPRLGTETEVTEDEINSLICEVYTRRSSAAIIA